MILDAATQVSSCLSYAGTPVQNNMRELFGLMNLLDDEKYADEDDFFEQFGGGKEEITLEQVQALQVSKRNTEQAGHNPFIHASHSFV